MSGERYFTRSSLDFLRELRARNNRDWFQANKERYEEQVRHPFLRLIADIAPELKKIDSTFLADSSPSGGSMMRIYRDTRFSKDKSPYKTYAAAHFWRADARDRAAPAFYLHFEPGASVIGGGIWKPAPWALKKIRDGIVADPKTWRRVTFGRELGSTGTIEGEVLKRPPPGYDADDPLIKDIKRKNFLIGMSLTDATVSGPDLKSVVLGRLRSTAPFLQFLSRALEISSHNA